MLHATYALFFTTAASGTRYKNAYFGHFANALRSSGAYTPREILSAHFAMQACRSRRLIVLKMASIDDDKFPRDVRTAKVPFHVAAAGLHIGGEISISES